MTPEMYKLATDISRLELGNCLRIPRQDIRDMRQNLITGEPGIEQLKSNVVGSAHNYRFTTDQYSEDLIIRRIEPDGLTRHVDWDRRDLYIKVGEVFTPAHPVGHVR